MRHTGIGVAGFLFLASAAAAAQDKIHVPVHRKCAPAVVYVEGGSEKGTGVIIDPRGLVLTSPTACGADSRTVSVITRGNRQHLGRVVGRVNEKELVLVQIDSDEEFPHLPLGDSDDARLGQTVYVIGDSFESIPNDDQAAISVGVVSGRYELPKAQKGSYYTGPVLETSAAVNPNQDGAPLLDREGRILGLVSLNYHDSRFTGLAVPINELREDILRLRREHATGLAVRLASEAWLGADVSEVEGGLQVTRVAKNGPAEKGGLRRGDLVTVVESMKVETVGALRRMLSRRDSGDALTLLVRRDGRTVKLEITLSTRPIY